MSPRSSPQPGSGPAPESYGRLMINVGSVLLAVIGLLVITLRSDRPAAPVPSPSVTPAGDGPLIAEAAEDAEPTPTPAPTPPAPAPRSRPKPRPPRQRPQPAPLPAPELDRAAVARAEAMVDAASRDRARAEARADDAARLLAAATRQTALDAATARNLVYTIRDPSSRIARATAQGGFLRAERDRLKDEVAAIRKAPRPQAKVLADRNPVARPTGGEEYHFEIRRNRVTFIDVDRLMEMVKKDLTRQIQQGARLRNIESQVGPVGAFSMQYVVGISLASTMNDLVGRRGITMSLQGWELVPEFEGRGETYEMAIRPASEFSRALNRLTPGRSTITMWIYPDGFPLYRKLRDDLHAAGYLVAARPLPEGMTIKGSPAGSVSAGQ